MPWLESGNRKYPSVRGLASGNESLSQSLINSIKCQHLLQIMRGSFDQILNLIIPLTASSMSRDQLENRSTPTLNRAILNNPKALMSCLESEASWLQVIRT